MDGYTAQGTALGTARKCGVLIADDESVIRDLLNISLQREGFALWLAADGQEALALYRDHREAIDVALLDVCMPRLDGPKTLAALQKLTPQIPCCFMSGSLGSYTEAGLRTQGARAVLHKPFHLLEVTQVLRELTGGTAPQPARAVIQRRAFDKQLCGNNNERYRGRSSCEQNPGFRYEWEG